MTERDATPKRAISVSPAGSFALNDDYVRSKLRQISEAQAAQAEIEHERTGAAKTMSRLVGVFGSLITAASIAMFAWVWNANATNAAQDTAIAAIEANPPAVHGHAVLVNETREVEVRVAACESDLQSIEQRLTRIENRLDSILTELRERRR